jgi:predicted permease
MKRRRDSRDFRAEIEAHIELEADRLSAEGMAPEEARAAARRAFGNRTIAEERFYERRRWMPGENLWRDVRFAVRVLAKDARFSLLAVCGLALGIGVSTAIFAIINAAMRAEAGGTQDTASLVGVARMIEGRPNDLSYAEYLYVREQARSFRDVAAESGRERFVLSPTQPGAEAEEIQGRFESANFLSAAGLHPVLGRSFSREEEAGAPVAMLNYRFWKSRFGGDPDVLGRAIAVNSHVLTIVGVTDGRMGGSDPSALYLPLALEPVLLSKADWLHAPEARWLMVSAWLRPGVAPTQARAETDVLGKAAGAQFQLNPGAINPQKRREILAVVYAVTIAVSMILLIACSNLANLLLARASARSREIGVRLSLGASRARLVRQLLTESLLLAIAGGVLGVAFSNALARFLMAMANAGPGLALEIRPDPRVVLYGLLLSLAAGLSFGLPPALAATRASVRNALQGDPGQGRGPRNLLVTIPLAVSLMLLLGAGVEVRNVQRIYFNGPAFEAAHLVGASLRLHQQGYDDVRARQFEDRLRERIAAMAGVASVALATSMPLANGYGWFRMAADRTAHGGEAAADYSLVSPEYFDTIGVRMVRGRGFTATDREGGSPVALVNEELVRTWWPGEEAIGRRVRLASGTAWFEVVGVAPDLEDTTQRFNSVRPTVYIPGAQGRLFAGPVAPESQLLIRTRGDAAALKAAVRQEVRAADASLLLEVRTIEEMLEARVGPLKTISLLLSALGGLALLMASVGIYAILAYAVSRRTREIGIRSALGATRRQILGLVMRRAALMIAWGVGGGLAAALAMVRIFAHSMAKFGQLDAVTCVAVSVLLAVVALAASWLPARKALRVDPVQALRWE